MTGTALIAFFGEPSTTLSDKPDKRARCVWRHKSARPVTIKDQGRAFFEYYLALSFAVFIRSDSSIGPTC